MFGCTGAEGECVWEYEWGVLILRGGGWRMLRRWGLSKWEEGWYVVMVVVVS